MHMTGKSARQNSSNVAALFYLKACTLAADDRAELFVLYAAADSSVGHCTTKGTQSSLACTGFTKLSNGAQLWPKHLFVHFTSW